MRRNQSRAIEVVYFGPGLAGRTTNLRHLAAAVNGAELGPKDYRYEFEIPFAWWKMVVPASSVPSEAGPPLLLRTVPMSLVHDPVRDRFMKSMDACVFVADSQTMRLDSNLNCIELLDRYVRERGSSLATFPWVIQYNKRDLAEIAPVEVLQSELNRHGVAWFEAVALRGEGVLETFRALSLLLIRRLDGS